MRVCRTCNGTKSTSGMGHMKEKCKNCDGKGYVSDTVRAKVDPEPEKPKAKPSSKKPKGNDNGEKESHPKS